MPRMAKPLDEHKDLIDDVLAYCAKAGIKPSTFGQRALTNRHFIARLQEGGHAFPRTVEKVRKYIADHPIENSMAAE